MGNIRTTLERFGEQAAQSRRRDDKTHTIGVSCRKVRELLHKEFSIDLSHITVWRRYTPSRSTDSRPVRDGGRYSLLEVSTFQVNNDQFVTPHPRGRWCAANNRNLKEWLTDLHLKGHNVWYVSWDGLARTPLVVDAYSHMCSRKNRGITNKGDGHKNYDHNQAVMKKLLMEVTGIVFCKPPNEAFELLDELGRKRLPRPKTKYMFDYCRGVPLLVSGTAEALHWADMEASMKALIPEHGAPDFMVICGDNGPGYDPTTDSSR